MKTCESINVVKTKMPDTVRNKHKIIIKKKMKQGRSKKKQKKRKTNQTKEHTVLYNVNL